MKQVTANVFAKTYQPNEVLTHGANSSFVTTSDGVVVIDTPFFPSNALQWREEIAGRGEVRFIINTEHHPDHVTGNFFFSGQVISSLGVKEAFSEFMGSAEAARSYVKQINPEGLALMKDYRPKPPAIAFSGKLNLYQGEHTFELVNLPGHTPGQVVVYVPAEKVAFTGDNFTNGWQPSLRYCQPVEWVKSLKTIEAMDVEAIVPGHGNVGDKKSLKEFRAFIEECVSVVRGAIKQGMSKEEALASITFDTRRYLPTLHPGREQQRQNVERLYDMLSN